MSAANAAALKKVAPRKAAISDFFISRPRPFRIRARIAQAPANECRAAIYYGRFFGPVSKTPHECRFADIRDLETPLLSYNRILQQKAPALRPGLLNQFLRAALRLYQRHLRHRTARRFGRRAVIGPRRAGGTARLLRLRRA